MTALQCLSPAPDIAPDEVLVVGCMRNESLRLPDFLTHHRRLGVTCFLLIDNASDDGTTEFLRTQNDVCLFHTSQPYSEGNYGMDWQNAVLHAHAIGHWTLIADADELLIYPGFETTGLVPFTAALSTTGATAMLAPLLDMYGRGPISKTGYVADTSLLVACPWFDGDGYETGAGPAGAQVLLRGGPRHRLFWDKGRWDFPSPMLRKIPLVKWQSDFALQASTHTMPGAIPAAVTGLLLHFKLLQDFTGNVSEEANRKEHFGDARQYVAYDEGMRSRTDLTAYWQGSVRFLDSAQLCGLGLMTVPEDYPFAPDQGLPITR